jgi:hypothetical protein
VFAHEEFRDRTSASEAVHCAGEGHRRPVVRCGELASADGASSPKSTGIDAAGAKGLRSRSPFVGPTGSEANVPEGKP